MIRRNNYKQDRPEFKYQRRSPAQWRALTRGRNGAEPIGKSGLAWLQDLLDLAIRHDRRLTAWESSFVEQLIQRFKRFGPGTFLTEKQRAALLEIERRIGVRR